MKFPRCEPRNPVGIAWLGVLTASFALFFTWTGPSAIHAADPVQQSDPVLFPIGAKTLKRVQIVENVPRSFMPDSAPAVVSRVHRRWRMMLRMKSNPDLFQQIATSYETHGLKQLPVGMSYAQRDLAEDWIELFVPQQVDREWLSRDKTEFEKVRAYREFVDAYQSAIPKLDVALPVRIGSLLEVRMGNYDAKRGGFPIQQRQSCAFENSGQKSFRYEMKTPFERLNLLPMKPAQAEALLKSVPDRTIYLFNTVQIDDVRPMPGQPTGVIVSADKQVSAFYRMDDFSRYLFGKKIEPKPELADPKTPRSVAKTRATRSVHQITDEQLMQRMNQLSAKLSLATINGIPLISKNVYSVELTDGQEKSLFRGIQRLADRMAIADRPNLFDETLDPETLKQQIPMMVRVLGSGVMAQYLDGRMDRWRGDNEFEIRGSAMRCIRDQKQNLLRQAIRPPFRFRTISRVDVEKYDFEKQRFPIRWRDHEKGVVLGFPSAEPYHMHDRLSLPMAIQLPPFLEMSPSKAETLTIQLQSQDSRSRKLYESIVFDVVATEKARPMPIVFPKQPLRRKPRLHVIVPVSMALYADNFLQQKVMDLPVDQFEPPAIVTGQIEVNSVLQKGKYLWQPEVQASLMEAWLPDEVKRGDWKLAAINRALEDDDYYRLGWAVPHQLRGLFRNNLYSRSAIRQQAVQAAVPAEFQTGYRPAFPLGFASVATDRDRPDASEAISDEQIAFMKRWMEHQMENLNDEYRIPSQIRVDTKQRIGMLDSRFDSRAVKREPIQGNSESLGDMTDALPPDDSPRWRQWPAIADRHQFTLVYPAMEGRLTFPIDNDSLNDLLSVNEQRVGLPDDHWRGDVVVNVTKLEMAEPYRDQPTVLIHVNPIRFEVLQSGGSSLKEPDRLMDYVEPVWTTPVKIEPYTIQDRRRDQKQAAAEAEAKEARRIQLEKELEEQQRLDLQEKQRLKEAKEEAERIERKRLADIKRAEYEEKRRLEEEKYAAEQAAREAEETEAMRLEGEAMWRRTLAERQQFEREQQLNAEAWSQNQEAEIQDGNATRGGVRKALTAAGLLGLAGLALLFWRHKNGLLFHDLAVAKTLLTQSTQSVKQQAQRKLLTTNQIPKAKMELGEAAFRSGLGRTSLSPEFDAIEQIDQRISMLLRNPHGPSERSQSPQPDDTDSTTDDSATATLLDRSKNKIKLEIEKGHRNTAMIQLADSIIDDPDLLSDGSIQPQAANYQRLQEKLAALSVS